MTTNDDTLYQEAQPVSNNIAPQPAAAQSGGSWKTITIGSVSGVLLGAGAMFAANAYANSQPAETEEAPNSHTNDNGLKVADINEDQSFADAFNEARDAVGPGGVFHWHGGIYSTYTKDEWDNMSDEERTDFAEQVRPEVRPDEILDQYITESHPEPQPVVVRPVHTTVIVNETSSEPAEQAETVETAQAEATPLTNVANAATDATPQEAINSQESTAETDDVHVIGQGTIEGHAAVAVDMTSDGEADVVVIDINDNLYLDEQDVIVDQAGNAATLGGEVLHVADPEEGTSMAAQPEADMPDPNMQTAQYDNPEVAPDMPDYMNDADVSGLV